MKPFDTYPALLSALAIAGGCYASEPTKATTTTASTVDGGAPEDAAPPAEGDGGALRLVCPKKAPFDDSVPGLVDQCTQRVLVAGLDGAAIRYSADDGATWSDPVTIDAAMTDAQLFGLTSGFGVVAAMTRGGVYTSTDLKTWTKIAFTAGYTYSGQVRFGGGQFVAAGTSGSYASTNGVDWVGYHASEVYPNGVTAGYTETYGLAMFGKRWILSGRMNPNAVVRSSDDGLSWTDNGPAGATRTGWWWHLAATADRALVVGSVGGGADTDGATSVTTDGVTWTDRVDAQLGLTAAASDGKAFVGIAGTKTLSSTDGVTWTTLATDAPKLNDLVWAEALWFGMNETGWYTSPDAVTWKQALQVPAHYLGALGYARVLKQ